MQPTLSVRNEPATQDLSELNTLSFPSTTSPAASLDLLNLKADSLVQIAKETPAEELSYFNFQVARQQSVNDLASRDVYVQGSLPSPKALLNLAA